MKGKKFISKQDNMVKYILIVALIVLLGFSLLYIYNIHNYGKKFEAFNDGSNLHVIYLFSENCPYCIDFTPVFNKFMSDAENHRLYPNVTFEKYEKNNPHAAKYMNHINGFPTVIVVDKNNKIVDTLVGSTNESALKQFVDEAVHKNA